MIHNSDDQGLLIRVNDLGQAFLFSHQPLYDGPSDPSAVTHRYGRMCAQLGIESHLHALRHYSATELLTAGIDLRTLTGRLGHGGGRPRSASMPRGSANHTAEQRRFWVDGCNGQREPASRKGEQFRPQVSDHRQDLLISSQSQLNLLSQLQNSV